MKLSLETYGVISKFGAREGLKLIKQAGFDCVDTSYYWQEEGSPLLGEGAGVARDVWDVDAAHSDQKADSTRCRLFVWLIMISAFRFQDPQSQSYHR